MSPDTIVVLVLCIPALCGGIVALVNSDGVNSISEKIEAWIRRRHGILSVKKDFSTKWIVRPPAGMIVKMCDWTDSLAHRGAKNGIRIATAIYVIGFWLLLTVYAFMMALAVIFAVVFAVIMVIITFRVMGEMLDGKGRRSGGGGSGTGNPLQGVGRGLLGAVGKKGQKVYNGTNWLNEELKGRVDEKGNVYSGTNWLNEEKIGKIDENGNILRGTSWLNEELVGRVDEKGNIHKGTNWLNEEKVGRIDEKGNVFEGTNWLNERKIGRSGS